MTHERLRKFNTQDTYPEQKLDNDLSQGVIARGTLVFLRGQVSQDLGTGCSLHADDPVGDPGAVEQGGHRLPPGHAPLADDGRGGREQVQGGDQQRPSELVQTF